MVDPYMMEDSDSEQELSLSQLFDVVEGRLDEMMAVSRYAPRDRRRPNRLLTIVVQPFNRDHSRSTGLN